MYQHGVVFCLFGFFGTLVKHMVHKMNSTINFKSKVWLLKSLLLILTPWRSCPGAYFKVGMGSQVIVIQTGRGVWNVLLCFPHLCVLPLQKPSASFFDRCMKKWNHHWTPYIVEKWCVVVVVAQLFSFTYLNPQSYFSVKSDIWFYFFFFFFGANHSSVQHNPKNGAQYVLFLVPTKVSSLHSVFVSLM